MQDCHEDYLNKCLKESLDYFLKVSIIHFTILQARNGKLLEWVTRDIYGGIPERFFKQIPEELFQESLTSNGNVGVICKGIYKRNNKRVSERMTRGIFEGVLRWSS